jgi:hypothetical protein
MKAALSRADRHKDRVVPPFSALPLYHDDDQGASEGPAKGVALETFFPATKETAERLPALYQSTDTVT